MRGFFIENQERVNLVVDVGTNTSTPLLNEGSTASTKSDRLGRARNQKMAHDRSASRNGRKKSGKAASASANGNGNGSGSGNGGAARVDAGKVASTTSVPLFRLPLEVLAAAQDTLDYERSLLGHYLFGTTFREGAQLYFQRQWEGDSEADGLRKRVQAFSLAQALLLWDEPHYRAPSYAHDLSAK